MFLKIRNIKSAKIVPSENPNTIDVLLDGVLSAELLAPIDITAAIEYFGVSELLDMIGERQINSYLIEIKDSKMNILNSDVKDVYLSND